jgi:hypothetical protein
MIGLVRRLEAILVVLILALAAGLRVEAIGAKPLWYDEIGSVLRADGRLAYADAEDGTAMPKRPVGIGPRRGLRAVIDEPADVHPPLFYVLLRWWSDAFGRSGEALRGLTVVFSLGTVVAAAGLAARLGGRRAGLIAGALVAASPFEVYYAQEARPYAILGLLATAATFALVRLAAGGRPAWWAAYSSALAVAFATGYTAALVAAGHVAGWLAARRPAALARLPVAIAAAALLVSPLAGVVARQVRQLASTAAAGQGLAFVGQAGKRPGVLDVLSRVPGEIASVPGHLAAGDHADAAVAIAAGLAVLGFAAIAVRGGDARVRLVAGLAALGPAVLVAVELKRGAPLSMGTRYAAVSGPALLCLAAVGIARARPAVAALGLALLFGAAAQGHVAYRARESKAGDFRGAARLMTEAGCDRRDLVVGVLWSDREFVELNLLLPGDPWEMLVGERCDGTAIERPWRNIFLLVHANRPKAGEDVRAFLAARRPQREEHKLEELTLYRFAAD